MQMEPLAEHRWLDKLVGEWTYESVCPAAPGGESQTFTGTESVRSLGGLWVMCEGLGEMPDGDPAYMITTLGYNPQTKRYVGTWVGSMMPHLWVYDGEVDSSGKVLTLAAEGPSMTAEGQMTQYHDIIEFISDDHRTLTSRMQDAEGNWQTIVTSHYHRKTS